MSLIRRLTTALLLTAGPLAFLVVETAGGRWP
jgi:hypothetical protein